jgi:hypothetical protein
MAKTKPLLNRGDLKQIKRSRTRVDGKKVVTDDVRKLKSLKVQPELADDEAIHYYKEPIWIEYYIPKESRFAHETKYLFVKLIDPAPRPGRDKYLKECIMIGEIVDIYDFMLNRPETETTIRHSYQSIFGIVERISRITQIYRETGQAEELKTACYLTESLIKFEPTLASLEYFGDYILWNLNYYIRALNREKIEFSLEDATVSLLIKRRNSYWEDNEFAIDEDFDLLAALFYEQAFPNRGADELAPEDLLTIE